MIRGCLRTINFSIIIFGLLPLSAGVAETRRLALAPSSTIKVEVAEVINSSEHNLSFPRRGELRRCFVTYESICIFQERFRGSWGVHYYGWSSEDLKAALQAEIAAKLAAVGAYEQAIALARTIINPSSKVAALTEIAAHYGEAGQTNQSQQILAEAEQTARHFNQSQALAQVAVHYEALGQTQTASQIIDEVIRNLQSTEFPLSSPEIYQTTEVIRGLLALDRTDQAEQLIRQILREDQRYAGRPCTPLPCPRFDRAQWNASIFEPLIDAQESNIAVRIVQEEINNSTDQRAMLYRIAAQLAVSGEVNQAVQLLQTIPGDGSHATQPGAIPPLVSLDEVINSSVPDGVVEQQLSIHTSNQAFQLAVAGDLTTALSVAETILLPHHKTLTLTEIAIYLLEVEQPVLAEQVLSQAVQMATTLEGNHSGFGEQQGLSVVAVRLAEAGQFTRALEVLKAPSLASNQPYEVVVLINIADQYIRLGQTQNALETLSTALTKTELLNLSRQ